LGITANKRWCSFSLESWIRLFNMNSLQYTAGRSWRLWVGPSQWANVMVLLRARPTFTLFHHLNWHLISNHRASELEKLNWMGIRPHWHFSEQPTPGSWSAAPQPWKRIWTFLWLWVNQLWFKSASVWGSSHHYPLASPHNNTLPFKLGCGGCGVFQILSVEVAPTWAEALDPPSVLSLSNVIFSNKRKTSGPTDTQWLPSARV
jgi:hypothetical protein